MYIFCFLMGLFIGMAYGAANNAEIKKLRIPILKIIPDEKLGFRMKVRPCPFLDFADDDYWCNLVKDIPTDECKICGINGFTDKDLERMERESKHFE